MKMQIAPDVSTGGAIFCPLFILHIVNTDHLKHCRFLWIRNINRILFFARFDVNAQKFARKKGGKGVGAIFFKAGKVRKAREKNRPPP